MNLSAYEIARRLIDSGVSLLPVALDRRKRPAGNLLPQVWHEEERRYKPSWTPFRTRLPTAEEARAWWDCRHPAGLAAVCGELSAVECVDFDDGSLLDPWAEMVDQECPGLVNRLTIHRTPRKPENGWHVWLRCPDFPPPGSAKLATDPALRPTPEQVAAGAKDHSTLIETRGEGGYAVLPGSPPECHPDRGTWQHHSGPPLWKLGPASIEEREVAWRCARYFDRCPVEQQPIVTPGLDPDRLRPGQDFDKRGPDWSELLEPHGWRCVYGSPAGERRWLRPGKEIGWSATTGVCRSRSDGADLFRVFSSNAAPFELDRAYGRFRVLALLENGGDLAACASRLARKGFGDKPAPRRNSHPDATEAERLLKALAQANPAALQAVLAPLVWKILAEGEARP